MIRFSEYLVEFAGEVNLASRLYNNLSSDAQSALNAWETSDWGDDGRLSSHLKRNDAVWQEILDAGEPIRSAISKRHGKSITLYRGMETDNQSRVGNRKLFSWSSRKEIADVFAGRARVDMKTAKIGPVSNPVDSFIYGNMKRSDIRGAQQKFDSKGYVKVGRLSFQRWKDDPKWMTVYHTKQSGKLREYQYGEPSDVEKFLNNRLDEYEQDLKAASEKNQSGRVVEKNIPIKDIIWVLNGNKIGSMEYIVQGHSGSKGKKI